MIASSLSLERLLQAGGFVLDGEPSDGLLDARRAAESAHDQLRYGELLDHSATPFGSVADFVYEVPSDLPGVPGSTCVYFKTLQDPSTDQIIELRKRAWNHGRSPTLWVVTPDSIRIYDAFARPELDDGADSHLLRELKDIDEQLLRMSRLDRSAFDSGEFWQSGLGMRIDTRERVDVSLLEDLTTTERLLVRQGLPVEVAHALLGRAIFAAYLQDRHIIGPGFFEQYDCDSLSELFGRKNATYAFFAWLRETFNGDLFPLSSEEAEQVELSHLRLIQLFLVGTDMSSYPAMQARLWPYLFDVIPIELISSIYEMFAHARNPERAEAISVHYTRLKLVELVLGMAMQELDDSAVILDPACGSGVFLVEAFRRLVWMRQERLRRPLRRDELHDLLRCQIFGIDVDRDAIRVAAFSLYLALLEMDPDPYPPAMPKFPHLSSASPIDDGPPNLYNQDAFNTDHDFNRHYPFVDREISLVVSNPPWTALKPSTAPRDPDHAVAGRQWGLDYCQQMGIPDRKPDQAFMLRAQDFAGPGTRIAFVIASRLFYQQPTKTGTWLEEFLNSNTMETVVNLSDLVGEDLLFGGTSSTRLPASVVIYFPRPPEPDSVVAYFAPKWSPDAKHRDDLYITSADMVILPQRLLQTHRFLWKSAFFGTSRDFGLIRKLEGMPALEQVLQQLDISDRGLGVQFGKDSQRDTAALIGKPFLDAHTGERYRVAVGNLPLFNVPTAERPRGPWGLPAVLAFRSLRADRACAALAEPTENQKQIVVDKMYYAISLSTAPEGVASRLNAVLNSNLAFYSAFLRSPALGWDRQLIEMSDWLATPVPESLIEGGGVWEEVQKHELWLRQHWELKATPNLSHAITDAESGMNRAIYQAYELSEQESILIEDAVRYTILPFRSRKRLTKDSFGPFSLPSAEQLELYASCLLEQLNGVLRYTGLELKSTIFAPTHTPIIACRFSVGPPLDTAVVNRVSGDVEDVLNQISYHLRSQVTDHLFVRRNLRVYDNEAFWVIKPAQSRLWTRAAALQDADVVIREHMETDVVAPVL